MSKWNFFWFVLLMIWSFDQMTKSPKHQSKEAPFAHLVWWANQTKDSKRCCLMSFGFRIKYQISVWSSFGLVSKRSNCKTPNQKIPVWLFDHLIKQSNDQIGRSNGRHPFGLLTKPNGRHPFGLVSKWSKERHPFGHLSKWANDQIIWSFEQMTKWPNGTLIHRNWSFDQRIKWFAFGPPGVWFHIWF